MSPALIHPRAVDESLVGPCAACQAQVLWDGALSEDTACAGAVLSSWPVPLYGTSPLLLPPHTAHFAAHPPEKVTGSLLGCRGVTRQALVMMMKELLCLWPVTWRRVPSPYSSQRHFFAEITRHESSAPYFTSYTSGFILALGRSELRNNPRVSFLTLGWNCLYLLLQTWPKLKAL